MKTSRFGVVSPPEIHLGRVDDRPVPVSARHHGLRCWPHRPEPVRSQTAGVVMAAAYSDGRRVSDIDVAEAGEWSRRPGHLVWIAASTSRRRICWPRSRPSSACTRSPSRTPRRAPAAQARTVRRLHLRGHPQRPAGRGAHRPRRDAPVRRAGLRRHRAHGGARRCPTGRPARRPRPVRSCSPTARTTSCTRCSTSSSTATRPSWRRCWRRSRPSRTASFGASCGRTRSSACTCCGGTCCGWRTAVVPLVEVCRKLEHGDLVAIDDDMQPLFRDVSDHLLRVQDEIDAVREVWPSRRA